MPASAYMPRLTKPAAEMAPRLHPRSSAMGFIMMPMVERPPLLTNAAASTYQP